MRCRAVFACVLFGAAAAAARAGVVASTAPVTTLPTLAVVHAQRAGSGEPVRDAEVRWEMDGDVQGSVETDLRGDCRIPSPGPTCQWGMIRLTKKGLVPSRIVWNAQRSPEDVSTLAAGRFVFVLEPGARVSGKAVDATGKPISGAQVYLTAGRSGPGAMQQEGVSWQSTTSDSSGTWAFDDIPPRPDTLELGGYDPLHLSDDSFQLKPYQPRSELFGGTAKLTFPIATPVSVTVLQPDGRPAAGATVFLGRDQRVVNDIAPVPADAHGVVHFGCTPGMTALLTAWLSGSGPAQQSITVGQQPGSVVLKLSEPRSRIVKVVDQAGKPVVGATVSVASWRGQRVLDVQRATDSSGQAVWSDGPADDIKIEAEKDGYAGSQQVTCTPVGVTTVQLLRPTIIHATVVDAQTGQPIEPYTIRVGAIWTEGDRMVWQGDDFTSNRTVVGRGEFKLQLDTPASGYVLRVQADGYLPADSGPFDPRSSSHDVHFRLTRGMPVAGRLLSAGGKPVPNADIYVVIAGDWMGLDNGAVEEGFTANYPHFRSKPDGSFAVPPQKEDFVLVVLSDQGSAILKREQLAGTSLTIPLRPWATVQGTAKVHSKPGGEVDIRGTGDPTNLGDSPVISQSYDVTTDKQGRFRIPRVAAGRLTLSRETSNYAVGRSWAIALGSVDAAPGKTYEVHWGESARVVGQLQIPPGEQWMIRQARLQLAGQPVDPTFNNVEVLPDGHFEAAGLLPGSYTLHVALHEWPPGNPVRPLVPT